MIPPERVLPDGPRARAKLGLVLTVFATIYLFLSIPNLNRFPPVHEDEPYIAASARSLAENGVYGNPLFRGFHGAERHVFLHPPLLPFIQAATFRLFGTSVETVRAPGIVAGLAVLLLAMILAARLGGIATACLLGVLLLTLRLTTGWNGTSGVPLLDISRIARQDVFVPVFGLSALLVLGRASARSGRTWLWLLCGVLVGLATLAHVYGAFYGIAFALVLLARSDSRKTRARAILLVTAGAAITVAPFALWATLHLPDFLGQQRLLTARYRVFDLRFILQSLLSEPARYRTLLPEQLSLARVFAHPGLWIGGLFGLAALAALARAYWKERTSLQFALIVTFVTQVVLFALLVQVKTYNYLIAVWPLAMLLLSAGAASIWRTARRGLRPMLATALTLVLAEGVSALVTWHGNARRVTPYTDFTARIAANIEPGASVLGLQRYWLGLLQFDYTSWLLPVWQSDPRFVDDPITLDAALERAAPDYVLLDSSMLSYFETLSSPAHVDHERYRQWQAFTRRRNASLVTRLNDSTYGTVEIYRVR